MNDSQTAIDLTTEQKLLLERLNVEQAKRQHSQDRLSWRGLKTTPQWRLVLGGVEQHFVPDADINALLAGGMLLASGEAGFVTYWTTDEGRAALWNDAKTTGNALALLAALTPSQRDALLKVGQVDGPDENLSSLHFLHNLWVLVVDMGTSKLFSQGELSMLFFAGALAQDRDGGAWGLKPAAYARLLELQAAPPARKDASVELLDITEKLLDIEKRGTEALQAQSRFDKLRRLDKAQRTALLAVTVMGRGNHLILRNGEWQVDVGGQRSSALQQSLLDDLQKDGALQSISSGSAWVLTEDAWGILLELDEEEREDDRISALVEAQIAREERALELEQGFDGDDDGEDATAPFPYFDKIDKLEQALVRVAAQLDALTAVLSADIAQRNPAGRDPWVAGGPQ